MRFDVLEPPQTYMTKLYTSRLALACETWIFPSILVAMFPTIIHLTHSTAIQLLVFLLILLPILFYYSFFILHSSRMTVVLALILLLSNLNDLKLVHEVHENTLLCTLPSSMPT